MALVTLGRTDRIEYGKKATFKFKIKFMSLMRPSTATLTVLPGETASSPVAGTITVAGATITLTDADIISSTSVAKKIVSSGVAGFTVYSIDNEVTLVSTSVGTITKPTVVLGTAKNMYFDSYIFSQGEAIPTTFDDIKLSGKVPVTIQAIGTGGTFVLSSSPGSDEDQKRGTLVYSALTLSSNMVTITSPTNFIKVTTNTGCTQIAISIAR